MVLMRGRLARTSAPIRDVVKFCEQQLELSQLYVMPTVGKTVMRFNTL